MFDCFVADFKVTKVGVNTFELKYDEYRDYCLPTDPCHYKALPEGIYSGEELIEFMLTGFENCQNLCLLFNCTMKRYNIVIAPWDGKRDQYLMCDYR